MPQKVEKLAVLFADVCGSTALYENLGDDSARQQIMRCINIMCSQIAVHQGSLIKTIGDEIMCVFPSAETAFHAACSMQIAVEKDRPLTGIPMYIRIGFNYGDVINESNDVFGNTVNIAARVATITRAGQIMATQAVFDALPANLRNNMRPIFRAEFKGMQDRLEVYQVIFDKEDMLSTRVGIPAYRKTLDNINEMTLRYRGKMIKVNNECRSVVLGREETCDIIVQSDLASRQHIRIEFRFGKFILADQSTNGSYIRSSDGSVVRISREETVVHGNGFISLGQAFADHPADLVEFSIFSAQAQH
jgi:adenylate cyclase